MEKDFLGLAIEKARHEYENSIIWGAVRYPETPANPDEITVFGGCSAESWEQALNDPSGLGHNFHKLATYRVLDLESKEVK